MKPVVVRGLEIGTGLPKICVPITGRTREEVLEQAAAIRKTPADLVEWRVDYFYNVSSLSLLTVLTFLAELRRALGDLPLLFTFRTAAEGGEQELSLQAYEELYRTVITSGLVDVVDVELRLGDALVSRLLAAAHDRGVPVLLSSHDFEKTPPNEEIAACLQRMQDLGADLAKVAVMPQSEADVETLLSATRAFANTADIPAVTMSMGLLGQVSRTDGERFGSAMTFGAAGQTSAPGQPDVFDLKKAIDNCHRLLI